MIAFNVGGEMVEYTAFRLMLVKIRMYKNSSLYGGA